MNHFSAYNQIEKPKMHCQVELESDLGYSGFISDQTLFKWFNDAYSASKHLLTLYSVARGLNAKTIVEIGFGRSSFVLARVAYENGGRLITCDRKDFSYLLSEQEKEVTTYINGTSEIIWQRVEGGIDLAFLDYFSDPTMSVEFCMSEIDQCLHRMKTNGLIALHDSLPDAYPVVRAMELLSARKNLEALTLPYNYGLGLIRKKDKTDRGSLQDIFFKKPEPVVKNNLSKFP